jgi:interleukin-1 receptor-associated kinase 1
VYEQLPNDTLMDRLCKGLLWKDRVTILAEQRSTLAYMHSRRPRASTRTCTPGDRRRTK